MSTLTRLNDFNQATSATTFAMAIGTVSVGDFIVVFTHQGNGDCTSITDSLGNTYTKAHAMSWFWFEDVYISTITTAGTSTLTATSGAAGFMTAQVYKLTDMQATPTDQMADNHGSSTTPSVTMAATTAVANEIVFGCFVNYNASSNAATPASGWTSHTSRNATDGDNMDVMYKGVTATGIYSPSGTYGTSAAWDGFLISFKANSALVVASSPTNLFFF